eukprot:5678712-Pleurochrysis_carterae.AAC.1
MRSSSCSVACVRETACAFFVAFTLVSEEKHMCCGWTYNGGTEACDFGLTCPSASLRAIAGLAGAEAGLGGSVGAGVTDLDRW